mmetsp:Transcript_20821/g.34414  ORF Transcript_20821/g.34414 Transcript_20821/m.34414 type:complete len:213 (-) Transcript_20821:149-787(-)|eukprot:CAMPEP_0119003610 /NCGR_PEP_ID=MMETSP1176-20130426/665_1 /TAXON_ID=265551 /ORGANISM="Synedropsis recta cf, Strain CCMP1620" /LENGTH=212 /DNA_ID=CAMNT_0006955227 /DNA_START=209 /DNA_END=847 /DNA_ORIENTATION=-
MVLCEGATILNLVASVMMNGVCCIHAMDEEERRKKETQETMRKVISVEWQRQRLIEQEQQERFLREQGLDAASVMADERRRLYIATKMMASSQHSSRASYSSKSQASEPEHLHYDNFVSHNPINKRGDDQDQITLPESPSPRFKFGASKNDYSSQREQAGLNSRSRSAPIEAKRNFSQRIPLLVGPASSMASSLFDDDSDDDDDEFDEVQLH